PGGLRVLPSYCVIMAMRAFPYVGEVDWPLFLHGEQSIHLHRPLPAQGKVVQVGEVKNIYDKGKGAVYDIAITGRTDDGELLYEAGYVNFYLGAGGFGGDPGPRTESLDPPEGADPDFSVTDTVPAAQAALYRLNGDLNPLHIDPAAAKRAGFDQPILHGLCTYGYAVRAVINGVFNGDTDALKGFRARFSSPVYPGEPLTTQAWKADNGYIVRVSTPTGPVITNAFAASV
ncbi:MAG: MaoC family dehydratase N-terminal domain-containing protein, partial [Deltaproteobacteria bacterium]|nr:MaoC family dehydratase N-terminal domain-containing protein [Deltaproteobacteria bacterium]